jgi:hypothetical protein
MGAYQLFQIAKKLTSGQLLLLRAAHGRALDENFRPDSALGAVGWLRAMADRLGHRIEGLVEQDERILVQNGLLTPRYLPDESGINDGNGRLTPLAFRFCENLEIYSAGGSSAGK